MCVAESKKLKNLKGNYCVISRLVSKTWSDEWFSSIADFISFSAECGENQEATEYTTYILLCPFMFVNARINVMNVASA